MPLNRRAAVIATGLAAALALTACTDTASDKEAKSRDGSYQALVNAEPAHHMSYSPTRATINGWIDTWGKKGAVSYVYLQNADGKLLGYYVLKGLPVSYCAALTPTQKINYDDQGNVVTNAPSVDGVYYSGGQCDTYYGFDAETGAYIEYTVGLGINVLLYNQPLPQANNVPNLAPSR